MRIVVFLSIFCGDTVWSCVLAAFQICSTFQLTSHVLTEGSSSKYNSGHFSAGMVAICSIVTVGAFSASKLSVNNHSNCANSERKGC